jgi:hypothetical protein
MIVGASLGCPRRRVPGLATQGCVIPTVEGIVTDLKIPLDERALDRLTLTSDAAVVAYQEQRLTLQAARKVRDHLAHKQTGAEDEIA